MIVARYAKSDPGRVADRSRLIEEHKAYLRNADLRILLSGPSAPQSEGKATTAIVIAEVETLQQFEEFSVNDPFVSAGVYESVEVFEWHPSFGDLLDALQVSDVVTAISSAAQFVPAAAKSGADDRKLSK